MLKRLRSKSQTTTSVLKAARAGNVSKVLDNIKWDKNSVNVSNEIGLTALHLAAKEGHVDIISALLTHGALIDAPTKKGSTALHLACLTGQLQSVKLLVQRGARINIQTQDGFTPLYMAAQENNVDVLKYLLQNGANPALATPEGFTPLSVALQQGHDKVVAMLLEHESGGKLRLPALHISAKKNDVRSATLLLQTEPDVNKISKSGFTALHIAAHYGNTEVAALLVNKGADVNYPARNGISPLHVASKRGHINMVNLLADHGAAVNCQTTDGLNPMHCAARAGQERVLSELMERGALVSITTSGGLTPLHMAVQGDHTDCVKLLLNHDAPIDAPTQDKLSPLHVAAHCGHAKSAKTLLDRKCNVNPKTINGFTPLHIACKKNRIKVVELLLKYGADIESNTESGLTPLHVASFTGGEPVVAALIQQGANMNAPTSRGETPLHLATTANQSAVVKTLLNAGANLDARDQHGQTPLHIASRLGSVENATLFLRHGALVEVEPLSSDSSSEGGAAGAGSGRTAPPPLHMAAREGHDEVALLLLEHGANPDTKNQDGFTPLHVAAKHGHGKIAKVLLSHDADPNSAGPNNLTPLHVATHYNNMNVGLALVDKGASPESEAKGNATPLHVAAQDNKLNAAVTLLELGASPSSEDENGYTPLHVACLGGHPNMASLMLEHGADANKPAHSGLTPLHLAAIVNKPSVGEVLMRFGANANSQTESGVSPLHAAAQYGNDNMVQVLTERDTDVNINDELGLTPLHVAARDGHVTSANILLQAGADPNSLTNGGQTALTLAELGRHDDAIELLRPITKAVSFQTNDGHPRNTPLHIPPVAEITALFSVSDRPDRSDSLVSLGLAAINNDLNYLHDSSLAPTDAAATDQEQQLQIKVNQKVASSPSALTGAQTPGISISPASVQASFTLIDTRGGTVRGHQGGRLVIPQDSLTEPTRVTCRLIAKERLGEHLPPLAEGEGIVSRVLQLGPVGVKFEKPISVELPHFASLHKDERELVVWQSYDGETWRGQKMSSKEHKREQTDNSTGGGGGEIAEEGGGDEGGREGPGGRRLLRVVVKELPLYLLVVSRLQQDTCSLGTEGGTISSKRVPLVQVAFPPGAFKRQTKVKLQVQPISDELLKRKCPGQLNGGQAAISVSPIVTLEPRRRKFHRAITVIIPLPAGMNSSGDVTTSDRLRLLCSVTGGSSAAVWEDITESARFTFADNCVHFTTTVSARFWLVDVLPDESTSGSAQISSAAVKMASDVYRETIAVPFLADLVVFSKTPPEEGVVSPPAVTNEAKLRLFCLLNEQSQKELDNCRQNFSEIARCRDVEVLDGKPMYLELAGNLTLSPTQTPQQSDQPISLNFHSFRVNRLPISVRLANQSQLAIGSIVFRRSTLLPETPQKSLDFISSRICSVDIVLPELGGGEDEGVREVDLEMQQQMFSESSRPAEEHISKAELRLTDMADTLQTDWIPLALQLGMTPADVNIIQSDFDYLSEQALVMLHLWVQKSGEKATGNNLEKALKQIGREDVITRCMHNIKEVTDVEEKAAARVYLDSAFDPARDDIGLANDFGGSSRGSSIQRGYGEHGSFKDSVATNDSNSEASSVVSKDEFLKTRIERMFKDSKVGERFQYMDGNGSKSPSNYASSAAESDAEMMPAEEGEMEAGAEYELEEVWDGNKWIVAHKQAPKKNKSLDETENEDDFQDARGTPTPQDVPNGLDTKVTPMTSQQEPAAVDQPAVLLRATNHRQPELNAAQASESKPNVVVERLSMVLQSDVDETEQLLDDGTRVQSRITTTRQVVPVIETSLGPEGQTLAQRRLSDEVVGMEIEEEIVELSPGVTEDSPEDTLESETSTEELEETLPDGTWVKRRVTRVVVMLKKKTATSQRPVVSANVPSADYLMQQQQLHQQAQLQQQQMLQEQQQQQKQQQQQHPAALVTVNGAVDGQVFTPVNEAHFTLVESDRPPRKGTLGADEIDLVNGTNDGSLEEEMYIQDVSQTFAVDLPTPVEEPPMLMFTREKQDINKPSTILDQISNQTAPPSSMVHELVEEPAIVLVTSDAPRRPPRPYLECEEPSEEEQVPYIVEAVTAYSKPQAELHTPVEEPQSILVQYQPAHAAVPLSKRFDFLTPPTLNIPDLSSETSDSVYLSPNPSEATLEGEDIEGDDSRPVEEPQKPVSSLVARFEGRESADGSEREFYTPSSMVEDIEIMEEIDEKPEELPASEKIRLFESKTTGPTEITKPITTNIVQIDNKTLMSVPAQRVVEQAKSESHDAVRTHDITENVPQAEELSTKLDYVHDLLTEALRRNSGNEDGSSIQPNDHIFATSSVTATPNESADRPSSAIATDLLRETNAENIPEITHETIEGEVYCDNDDFETVEPSEDPNREIRRKVITIRFIQPLIHNTISDGRVIESSTSKVLIGIAINDELWDTPANLSDPNAANVETRTSVEESEETMPDGSWFRRTTIKNVSYVTADSSFDDNYPQNEQQVAATVVSKGLEAVNNAELQDDNFVAEPLNRQDRSLIHIDAKNSKQGAFVDFYVAKPDDKVTHGAYIDFYSGMTACKTQKGVFPCVHPVASAHKTKQGAFTDFYAVSPVEKTRQGAFVDFYAVAPVHKEESAAAPIIKPKGQAYERALAMVPASKVKHGAFVDFYTVPSTEKLKEGAFVDFYSSSEVPKDRKSSKVFMVAPTVSDVHIMNEEGATEIPSIRHVEVKEVRLPQNKGLTEVIDTVPIQSTQKLKDSPYQKLPAGSAQSFKHSSGAFVDFYAGGVSSAYILAPEHLQSNIPALSHKLKEGAFVDFYSGGVPMYKTKEKEGGYIDFYTLGAMHAPQTSLRDMKTEKLEGVKDLQIGEQKLKDGAFVDFYTQRADSQFKQCSPHNTESIPVDKFKTKYGAFVDFYTGSATAEKLKAATTTILGPPKINQGVFVDFYTGSAPTEQPKVKQGAFVDFYTGTATAEQPKATSGDSIEQPKVKQGAFVDFYAGSAIAEQSKAASSAKAEQSKTRQGAFVDFYTGSATAEYPKFKQGAYVDFYTGSATAEQPKPTRIITTTQPKVKQGAFVDFYTGIATAEQPKLKQGAFVDFYTGSPTGEQPKVKQGAFVDFYTGSAAVEKPKLKQGAFVDFYTGSAAVEKPKLKQGPFVDFYTGSETGKQPIVKPGAFVDFDTRSATAEQPKVKQGAFVDFYTGSAPMKQPKVKQGAFVDFYTGTATAEQPKLKQGAFVDFYTGSATAEQPKVKQGAFVDFYTGTATGEQAKVKQGTFVNFYTVSSTTEQPKVKQGAFVDFYTGTATAEQPKLKQGAFVDFYTGTATAEQPKLKQGAFVDFYTGTVIVEQPKVKQGSFVDFYTGTATAVQPKATTIATTKLLKVKEGAFVDFYTGNTTAEQQRVKQDTLSSSSSKSPKSEDGHRRLVLQPPIDPIQSEDESPAIGIISPNIVIPQEVKNIPKPDDTKTIPASKPKSEGLSQVAPVSHTSPGDYGAGIKKPLSRPSSGLDRPPSVPDGTPYGSEVSPDGASNKKPKIIKTRVKKLITRKVRKVRYDGEVVEDVVTEEIPDTELSETSSMRSGRSDSLMSPTSPTSLTSPADDDAASPTDSVTSRSSLRVYTDTVEGEPQIVTDVTETEETLPDGRVMVRKIIKTRQTQTIVKRIVMEGPEETGAPGLVENSNTPQLDAPEMKVYTDSVECDPLLEVTSRQTESVLKDGSTAKTVVNKVSVRQMKTDRTQVEGPYSPSVVQQSGVQLRLTSPTGSEDSHSAGGRRPPSLSRIQASPARMNASAGVGGAVSPKPKFRVSMESSPRPEGVASPVITQPRDFVETVEEFVLDNPPAANKTKNGAVNIADNIGRRAAADS